MSIDINLVALCGRLAAAPETRDFVSGGRLIRYLVAVKSDRPQRRVDVLPVTLWDPPDHLWDEPGETGARFWAAGSLQRRFWEGPEGNSSRLEVIAEEVLVGDLGEHAPVKL